MEDKNTISNEVILDDDLPTISVCIIAKNEEKNLSELLPLLKDFEEVIVVDTGSVDKTKEVAGSFGNVKVYDFPWNNNFSDARNESLKYATMDYCIWLDCDDRINPPDVMKLKYGIQENPGQAYHIILTDMQDGSVNESLQLRIVPNHRGIIFRKPIHEQLAASVEELGITYGVIPFPVFHTGYSDEQKTRDKLKRNLLLLQQESIQNPDDFEVLLNYTRTASALGLNSLATPAIDKAIQLYLDGKAAVSSEIFLIAVVAKASLLIADNKIKEAVKFTESYRYMFPHHIYYKLFIGELYFNTKNYEKAYKDLLAIRSGNLPVTLFPINRQNTANLVMNYLFFTSLAVGDKKTVEVCASQLINDPNFKVSNKIFGGK